MNNEHANKVSLGEAFKIDPVVYDAGKILHSSSYNFLFPFCPCIELLINATQVTYSFCKEFRHLLLGHVGPDGDVSVTTIMQRLFDLNLGSSSKATAHQNNRSLSLSQAYHRYALNYINALNYLESLRRHQEFCDFEKVRQCEGGRDAKTARWPWTKSIFALNHAWRTKLP